MGGIVIIDKDHENQIRGYLFGQLAEADEETLELRLLTEPAFVEEFDTVVDEVTDQYVRNELEDGEHKGFEKSYLSTAEGRQKVRFTSELLERAAAERGRAAAVVKPVSFFDQARAFWQVQSLPLAATAAAVVIIASGLFFVWKSSQTGPTHYATVNLTMSSANRAEGPAPPKVKLDPGVAGIEVNLVIPEQEKGAKDYRVKLVSGDGSEHELKIDRRDDRTLTVKIPASLLSRGSYAIQIFSVASDGTEQRIRGNYYLDIQ